MTFRRFTGPRRAYPAGVSLIEMVLLIASITVILSACGTFLHLLMKLDRAGRDAMRDSNSVARLARQFRGDVRAAAAAKVVEPEADRPGRLELTTEGRPTVTYRVESGSLLRTESDGAKVYRREAYLVEHLDPPRFESVAGGRLVLTLPRRADAAGPTLRPGYRVEALLAKDRRPETAAKKKEAPR